MSESEILPLQLKTSLDLRRLLLQSLEDLIEKRITPNDARARAWLAKAVIDTVRVEITAARQGLSSYKPVNLIAAPADKAKT